jgi:RND family efflux transporter MFP subunit
MKNFLKVLLLLVVALAGCRHQHNHIVDGNHDEHIKSQYWVYTPEMELFAEADPFVVGEPSRILLHLTSLPDFKPMESGHVTLVITSEKGEIRQTVEKALKDGIYDFLLKPDFIGTALMKAEVRSGGRTLTAEIPGVKIYASGHEAEEEQEIEEAPHVNSVVFPVEKAWKTGFSTALPDRKSLGNIIKTIARVDPSPVDETIISAKLSGIVYLSGMNLTSGAVVYRGEKLCSVSGTGLADNNITVRYREAENNYVKAEADYNRIKNLAREKIVSEKELLDARIVYENSKNVYDQLRESFSASGENVVSPIPGFIGQIYVKNGQFVEPGQPLLTVIRDKNLQLIADIRQSELPAPGAEFTATIRTSPGNRVFSLDELKGKVVSVGRSVSGDNFLVPVTMRITNPGGILPGSLVEVWLKSATSHEALTVPVSALLEEQGIFFVYVQVAPELYEKREVKTGASDGLETEILAGISDNERIVTKGVIMVRLSSDSGALDPHAGHVH